MERLSSEAKPGDERPITGHVLAGEVVQQLSTPPDETKKAHPGVGVLTMNL